MNLLTSSSVTVMDISDIEVSNIAPRNPQEGTIWLDTSSEPPYKFKIFRNNKWEKTNYESLEELNPDEYAKLLKSYEEITSLDDDGKLTRYERGIVNTEITEIVGKRLSGSEHMPTIAQIDSSESGEVYSLRKSARDLGVSTTSTEYVTFTNAYNNLRNISSYSPKPWSTDDDTIISVSTSGSNAWDKLWQDYYYSRNSLQVVVNYFIKKYTDDSIGDIGITDRNIILKSNITRSSSSYFVYAYDLSQDWEANTTYSIAIKGDISGNNQRFGVWANGSSIRVAYLEYDSKTGLYVATFTTPANINSTETKKASIYNYPSSGAESARIDWIKLAKGSLKIVDWTPAYEDFEDNLNQIEERVKTAENKITDDAITNTVTTSTKYRTDLNDKVDSNTFKTKTDSIEGTMNGIGSPGKNLVINGGFENGMFGWRGSGGNHNSSAVHSGSHALRFVGQSGVQRRILDKPIPVEPGRKYEVSYWYCTSSGANGIASNQKLRFGRLDGSLVSSFSWDGSQTSWQKFTREWTCPSGLHEVEVAIIANNTSGWVNWDDISIVDITESEDAKKYTDDTTGNLVKNPVVTGSLEGWRSSGTLHHANTNFQGTTILTVRSTSSGNSTVYSDWFDIDPSKAYEVSMWLRKNANRGRWYVGLHGSSTSEETNNRGFDRITDSNGLLSIGNSENFYFVSGANNASTEWTKMVGYIMPHGTDTTSDPSEMKQIGENVNYNARMFPDTKKIRLRWLNYGNDGTSTQMFVALPRVTEVPISTAGNMRKIVSRVNSAEQKITSDAITNTVRQSTQYKNDMNSKVSTNEIISRINQTAETVEIDASKINFNGKVTFSAFDSNVQGRINQGTSANSTISSNKSTWDRSSNINSNGTFNTSKLNGTVSETQINSTTRGKWNTASSDASSAVSKLNSTEFNTINKNYYFEKTIPNGSGGRWYRIAKVSGNGGSANYRGHAKFILRDTTSSQHATAVFEAGINFGRNPYINLTTYGRYVSASFSQARILYKGTYDEAYLEVYINNNARAQSLSYWITDNIQVSGWVGVNWTNGSIPSGYSSFSRVLNEDNVVQGTVDKWRWGNTVEIDGGNIRANTLKALQIDVDNLFANNAVVSNIQSIEISAEKIKGGIFQATNGRTKINMNTGLVQMANTRLELGGGADIEFTDEFNTIYYQRRDTEGSRLLRSAGFGVTTGVNERFPVAFLGTSTADRPYANSNTRFSGFIANTRERTTVDDIGNSVVGRVFHIRDEAHNYMEGWRFDLNGSSKSITPINSSLYDYEIGSNLNQFNRLFVHDIRSGSGTIRFRNSNPSYTNQGFTMETTYDGEQHLHFRGTHSNDYWSLGKSGGWRFSYAYLIYQPDVSSDRRLKEEIQNNNLGLDFINDIKTKTFKLINNNPNLEREPTQYGLIAQDLRDTLIKHNVDVSDLNMLSQGSDGMYGVQYSQLTAPLIKSVQELSSELNTVKNNFNILKISNEQLVLDLAELKMEVNELKNS